MSHRIHSDLYRVSKSMADPGNGGTIRVTEDLLICEMVSVAKETRILASPTKPGIRFVLRLMVDGGTVDVSTENGFNAAGTTGAAFADASDLLSLVSVEHEAGPPKTYRWEIIEGNIGVSISA